ncbi:hypothetical protein CHS0354_028675 [Potamilus streckersoni]|uniref:ERI1 exoribonuclease 2 n=1 Tax=Potamilus streckersoni TaxID=2493646 RepID=A0AAE0W3V8_9BIVA|nr:hypothetical protein CHS0354_028675 [Potamilus streckersoni]
MLKMKTTKELARELGLLRKRTISSPSVQLERTSKVNVQLFSYLVVIDFESTCWQDGKFRTQEIIEFPAVLLNTETGQIEGEFHHYIQPQEDPILSEFCTELTGINQAQVDEGIPLPICLRKFSHWLDKLQNEKGLRFNSSDPHKNKGTFVTWSDWDLGVCLLYECKRKQILKPIQLNSWIDLRATYRKFYGRKPNGLNGALEDLGISFQGREHSGLDDARNTAKLAWRMMCDGCVMKITKTIKPQNSPVGVTIKKLTSNLPQKNHFDHRESKVIGQPDIPYLPENVTDTEHVGNEKQKCEQKHTNVKVVNEGRTSCNVECDAIHHSLEIKDIKLDENYHCENRSPMLPDQNRVNVSSVVEDSSKDKTVDISQKQITCGSKRSVELTPRSSKQRSKIPKIVLGKAFTSSEIYRDPENPKHIAESPKMTRISSELRVMDMNIVNSNSDRMESNIKDCIDVNKGVKTSDPSSSPKKFYSDIEQLVLNCQNKSRSINQDSGINQKVKTSPGRVKSSNPQCKKENYLLSKKYTINTILNPPTFREAGNNQPFCGTTTAGDRTVLKTPNTSCVPGKSIGHNRNSSYTLSPNVSSISSRLTSQFKTPTLVQTSNANQCRTQFRTYKIPGNLSFKTVSPSGSETPDTSRLNASSSMKSTPPLCKCGRRAKRRMVQSPGPNMGRFFFTCSSRQDGDDTRKKGCGFFKWENSTHLEKSFSHNNSRNLTVNDSMNNQSLGVTNRKSLGVRCSVRV